MDKNKWRIEIRDNYTVGEQTVIKSHFIAIPPTNGDRTDILDEHGMYHFGVTKSEFMGRMSKEDYLEQTMPNIKIEDEKERKDYEKMRAKALKDMTWTPRIRNTEIAIIIEIKNGEVTLKGK